MRAALLALAVLLCGCGSLSGSVAGSATVENGNVSGNLTVSTPLGNVTFGSTGIRGELAFLVTIVDFTDQRNPLSESDVEDMAQRLDAFVARNTTGLAYLRTRVARVTIGATADYTSEAYPEGVTGTKLQRDAKSASPGAEPFKLYLLPASPILATGGGFTDGSAGEAFVSCWTAWQNLPIVHEIGHALGLPHGDGVMRQGSPFDNDWNGILPLR